MVDNVVIDMSTKRTRSSAGDDGPDDQSSATKIKSNKPKYSKFTQQELPACKPILTPGLVIATFTLVGIIFLPIGFSALSASDKVVEIVDRYDMDCVPDFYSGRLSNYIQSAETNKTCTRRLTVPKQMKSPVFIYYQLDNFYQNHRRYTRSRSDNQLMSKANEWDVKTCKPEQYVDGKPIVPCGLVAWSLFNDTYSFSIKNKSLNVNKKDIAWKSDKERKFGADVYPKNFQTGGVIGGAKLNSSVPLSEQEDLMVWMRPAALPKFRKLYGRIEMDIEANDVIEVEITNNYNSYAYGGKKRLVLSTTSWIGGRNRFLGIAYITIGGFCFLFAITFLLIYVLRPRSLGDPSYLSWNRCPAGVKL